MLTKCERMHIDTADNVPMACEAAFSACPISSLGLVFVLAYRTLATCTSFRASRALDASLFSFMCEVVNILAIFPQGHSLVVVASRIAVTDPMGITNEERADVVFLAEADHKASRFVAQITDTTLCSCLGLVLGSLQLSPSSGMRLASGLLFGNFAQLLASVPFERSNATTCYNHGLPCVCANSSKMDLTQIDRCMNRSWRLFGFLRLNTNMQLKAIVPDQATCAAVFGQFEMQSDGLASIAHGQNHASRLLLDGLSRPFDWIEALFSPGIFHPQLGMSLTELARGIDVGKEGMDDHLHRLRVQCKWSAFGGLLQRTLSRPEQMFSASLFVRFDAKVPDFRSFHLRISK